MQLHTSNANSNKVRHSRWKHSRETIILNISSPMTHYYYSSEINACVIETFFYTCEYTRDKQKKKKKL
jgi:hypothetical protein